jgi:YD repeat-containing protein
VEQLVLGQSANRIVWVGADGSAAIYDQVGTNRWVRAAGAFRDTLVYAPIAKLSTIYEYTRTIRHGAQVKFASDGRHVRTISRTGLVTTLTWSSSSPRRLLSIQVPTGGPAAVYSFTWDGSSYLDGIADPVGRSLNATVTGGNLTQLTDPDNVTSSFTYDAARRMTRRTFRRPYAPTYAYGNNLHVTRVAYPQSLPQPDSAADTLTWWDERGLALGITSGTLSSTDTLLSYTKYGGGRSGPADDMTFWVDRWGAPTKIQNALGYQTLIARGDPARPAVVTRVQYPDGRVLLAAYNGRSNLDSVSDSTHEGTGATITATTRFLYGSANAPDSPTEIRTPVDTTRIPSYTSLGLPDSIIAPGGHRTVFSYTTSGLIQSVTNRSVRVVDTTGWTRSSIDLTTTFLYDAYGNDSIVTLPSGARLRYEWDGYRRVTRAFDAANHRSDYGYDLLNRLLQVTTYQGMSPLIERYFYSSSGQIDSVLDPRNVRRAWGYDAADRPIYMWDDAQGEERRYYGRSGLLDSIRTRAGHLIRYRYDNLGRLTATVYPAYQQGPFYFDFDQFQGGLVNRCVNEDQAATLRCDDTN